MRNRLKERLHSDNYAPYLVEAGQVNEAMREAIVSIAGDKQIENEMDVDTEIEVHLKNVELKYQSVD